jgi:hypothetical protein
MPTRKPATRGPRRPHTILWCAGVLYCLVLACLAVLWARSVFGFWSKPKTVIVHFIAYDLQTHEAKTDAGIFRGSDEVYLRMDCRARFDITFYGRSVDGKVFVHKPRIIKIRRRYGERIPDLPMPLNPITN